MILYDYTTFDKKYIQYKDTKDYKGGKFVEIRYQKRPFYLQTPSLITPFGINRDFNHISLSFTDRDIDPRIEDYCRLILTIDDTIVQKLKKKGIVDDQSFRHSIKYHPIYAPMMDLKIKNMEALVFDENRQLVDSNYLEIDSYVMAIIQLVGIWINEDRYGCLWNVLQMKVCKQFEFEKCSIIEYPLVAPPPVIDLETNKKSITPNVSESKGKILKTTYQTPSLEDE